MSTQASNTQAAGSATRFRSSRISAMPREQRDTLFTLSALLFILIPHFFYLPAWASAITLLTLLWRAWLTRKASKLPGTAVKVLLLILFVALTLFNFKSIAGPEAGGTLLVMLVCLKTLELRARRDALIIFYLGFFLMMLGFFQSQNIPTAAAMLVALVALIAALVNAHMPAGYPPLWDSVRIALKMMMWGTPIMVVLFLTFPRFDPLWALPDTTLTRTGVSDELTIYGITNLAQDSSIAFRVKFEGTAPAQKDLYFRGPVLSFFDGTTWRGRELPFQAIASTPAERRDFFRLNGPAVNYEVTIEPTNQPWLFTLDITPFEGKPILNDNSAFMNVSMQWMSTHIIRERTRYTAQAYLDYRAGTNIGSSWLESETRRPRRDSNLRTRAWAEELMQNPAFASLSAKDKAQWLLDYIRRENFHYTLTPPAGYTASTAADQLWFDYKAGFCEHYAFAFTVLMRNLGIPARIVTGYQGAEPNLVDSYWIVRQSNAHAWTEIWQENEGWIRVDPTQAIAPERINNGSLTANPQQTQDGGFEALPFFDKFLMRWDALENRWNQWVLSYTTDSGINFLEWLGLKNATWWTLFQIVVGSFGLILGCIYVLMRWKNRNRDVWLQAYTLLRMKLQRIGYASDQTTGPRTLAKLLYPATHNDSALKQAYRLLLELEKIRYAPASAKRMSLKQMTRAINQLNFRQHH